MFDWSKYAIDGALRPDSFTRMTPEMQTGLSGFLRAADAELGPGLQVYSGYRSPELQAILYRDAVKKYGGKQAARRYVAPPGKSKHNSGQAADLKFNGVRIDKLPKDHPARVWISANVAAHGLSQPMSWEPWQVETAGARGGKVPTAQNTPAQNTPAQPKVEKPQNGILDVLLSDVEGEEKNGLQLLGELLPQEQPQMAPMQMAPRQASSGIEFEDPLAAARQRLSALGLLRGM